MILNKLKKILFVSHDVNRAGAQLFLLSIMKYFKASGTEVILLVINDWGNLKSELESQFEVHYVNQTTTHYTHISKSIQLHTLKLPERTTRVLILLQKM